MIDLYALVVNYLVLSSEDQISSKNHQKTKIPLVKASHINDAYSPYSLRTTYESIKTDTFLHYTRLYTHVRYNFRYIFARVDFQYWCSHLSVICDSLMASLQNKLLFNSTVLQLESHCGEWGTYFLLVSKTVLFIVILFVTQAVDMVSTSEYCPTQHVFFC